MDSILQIHRIEKSATLSQTVFSGIYAAFISQIEYTIQMLRYQEARGFFMKRLIILLGIILIVVVTVFAATCCDILDKIFGSNCSKDAKCSPLNQCDQTVYCAANMYNYRDCDCD
jgi:hypothetical protein